MHVNENVTVSANKLKHFITRCYKYKHHRKQLEIAIRNHGVAIELRSILTNSHTVLPTIEFLTTIQATGRDIYEYIV